MKLTNKQKLSIWKSLKLNEDFFDDIQSDIYDETGFDLENEEGCDVLDFNEINIFVKIVVC